MRLKLPDMTSVPARESISWRSVSLRAVSPPSVSAKASAGAATRGSQRRLRFLDSLRQCLTTDARTRGLSHAGATIASATISTRDGGAIPGKNVTHLSDMSMTLKPSPTERRNHRGVARRDSGPPRRMILDLYQPKNVVEANRRTSAGTIDLRPHLTKEAERE